MAAGHLPQAAIFVMKLRRLPARFIRMIKEYFSGNDRKESWVPEVQILLDRRSEKCNNTDRKNRGAARLRGSIASTLYLVWIMPP